MRRSIFAVMTEAPQEKDQQTVRAMGLEYVHL